MCGSQATSVALARTQAYVLANASFVEQKPERVHGERNHRILGQGVSGVVATPPNKINRPEGRLIMKQSASVWAAQALPGAASKAHRYGMHSAGAARTYGDEGPFTQGQS